MPNATNPREIEALLAFMKCLAPFSCDRNGEGLCYVCEAKDAIEALVKENASLREQRKRVLDLCERIDRPGRNPLHNCITITALRAALEEPCKPTNS